MNKEEIKKELRYLKNYKQRVWTDKEILQHDRLTLTLEKMLLEQENKKLKEKIQELKADYGNKAQVERDLLQQELDKINSQVIIMEKYLELISDLGYDYDGCNNIESLKGLVDELVHFASLGRVCCINEPIYINGNKKYNILGEELK